MIKMLIDVDTGVDDSIALIYALKKPGIHVVGITTGCGNVNARQAADNTCRILDLLDADMDIPVVVGADKPLEGSWEGAVVNIHGENGLGNVNLPCSKRKIKETGVEEFLYEMSEKYPGELVLVTLGRLTNIAKTLEKYPEFSENINKMVMMGGTLYQHGNVTPVAEANIEGDPLACDKVFRSGMDITVVGLDVTMKTRLKREQIDLLERCCKEEDRNVVRYMKSALAYYMKGNRIQDGCLDDCPVHDPLAVMVAVCPQLVHTQKRRARVECHGDFCRGMIVTDLRHHPFAAEEISFALEVNANAAVKELLSIFW